MTAVPVTTTRPYVPAKPYAGGRCKGVFVGINYDSSDAELKGCINDVSTMLILLEKMNYPLQEAVILVDDVRFPGVCGMPTYDNIIAAMRWLSDDARPGDLLFFQYSGHSTYLTPSMKQSVGDKTTGMNEAIVPVDYLRNGLILDDDIFQYMLRPLPPGTRLTAVFDACHSGTIIDLPFVWSPEAVSYAPTTSNVCCADAVIFSACADPLQPASPDSVGPNFKTPIASPAQAGGACSSAMHDAIMNASNGPRLSYAELLAGMRDSLQRRQFSQRPLISSAMTIDIDAVFSLKGPLPKRAIEQFEDIVVVEPVAPVSQTTTTTTVQQDAAGVIETTTATTTTTTVEIIDIPMPVPVPAPSAPDFEAADPQDQFTNVRPGGWARDDHVIGGYGYPLYRRRHGEKQGRLGFGWGSAPQAGVLPLWLHNVGSEDYIKAAQGRRGVRRCLGKPGRPFALIYGVEGVDSDEEVERSRRRHPSNRYRGHGPLYAPQDPSVKAIAQGGNKAISDRSPEPSPGRIRYAPIGGGRFPRGASIYERLGSFNIPTDPDAIKALFETFDVDYNGTIDRAEFVQAMSRYEAQMGLDLDVRSLGRAFQRYDVSKDGRMSFPEFQVFLLARASQ